MKRPSSALLVLGNQLFPVNKLPPPQEIRVFMAEDIGLCTYVRHHQQKIVLFLAAMRSYADELRAAGYHVHYETFEASDQRGFARRMADHLSESGATELRHFEIENKTVESSVAEQAASLGLPRREMPSPMFLCSRDDFTAFCRGRSRLLMADFYKQQRVALDLLVNADGTPHGDRWSFDADNRRKLPRNVDPPAPQYAQPTAHVKAVINLVVAHFADHPGDAHDFAWPTTRRQALRWLDDFIAHRLHDFGPFEDAISKRSDTVFHSLLTPMLNIGLLTPDIVIDRVLQRGALAPLQSVEGFIRQIIGWREFVRGIYREFSEQQEASNFWGHERSLTESWYRGSTGIPPLDDAIRSAQTRGWNHHILRLMVIGNLMTLCEIHPAFAHRWFMELYVDSSEWVMGPNVYGMALFSDGGVFATKPYICGSNYMLKMSDYKKGPWCEVVDGLYWRFIDRHREFFSSNPRLALMPKALDRLSESRRNSIFAAAEEFLESHTQQRA